jgi:hypothetical protein
MLSVVSLDRGMTFRALLTGRGMKRAVERLAFVNTFFCPYLTYYYLPTLLKLTNHGYLLSLNP